MKAFGMTTTAVALSANGMKLRLENPASAFNPGRGCQAPPYVLPDKAGGYITLVEYGEPICNEGCATPKSCGGCGCGGCKPDAPKCETEPVMPGDGVLRRYEEIQYSGYDSDGQTLILTKRAVDGLTEQEWPKGTLVMQSGAAAYISALEKLGCLMAVQKARDCLAVKAGEWVADPTCQCWRRAKKDVVISADAEGKLDFPAVGEGETERWSKCYGINDLLDELIEPITVPFVTKCVSSGGVGKPFDSIYVDGSLIDGIGPRKIDYLPHSDATHPLNNADWIPFVDADSGIIKDAELAEQGGYIRVGVERKLGWQYAIQKVEACCRPDNTAEGSFEGSFGFCFRTTPPSKNYYRMADRQIGADEWPGSDYKFGYAKLILKNDTGCAKKFRIYASAQANRVRENIGQAIDQNYFTPPLVGAAFQLRFAEAGSQLLYDQFQHDTFSNPAHGSLNAFPMLSDESYVAGGYESSTLFPKRVQFSYHGLLNRASIVGEYLVQPGETKEFWAFTHLFYSGWDNNGSLPDTYAERVHQNLHIFAAEDM